jgi:hypothetical protein
VTGSTKGLPVATRFAAQHVPVPEAGCWLWVGTTTRGYGRIRAFGSTQRAHRVSWLIHRGPIPSGIGVCHRCDTPSCVNPDHLFLGDQRDNLRDMVRKGRCPAFAKRATP